MLTWLKVNRWRGKSDQTKNNSINKMTELAEKSIKKLTLACK